MDEQGGVPVSEESEEYEYERYVFIEVDPQGISCVRTRFPFTFEVEKALAHGYVVYRKDIASQKKGIMIKVTSLEQYNRIS